MSLRLKNDSGSKLRVVSSLRERVHADKNSKHQRHCSMLSMGRSRTGALRCVSQRGSFEMTPGPASGAT